jgi:hypothetical protein
MVNIYEVTGKLRFKSNNDYFHAPMIHQSSANQEHSFNGNSPQVHW